MGGGPGGGADSAMVTYLEKHRDGAKWLVAVSSSQSAAQLIVSTKQLVISMWGWSGSDKAMTLAKLKELVKKGELHYIVLGGGMGGGPGGGGMGGGDSAGSEVTAWVQEHATAVKASEYGGTDSADSDAGSGSGTSDSPETESDSAESDSQTSQNTQALYRLDASDVN